MAKAHTRRLKNGRTIRVRASAARSRKTNVTAARRRLNRARRAPRTDSLSRAELRLHQRHGVGGLTNRAAARIASAPARRRARIRTRTRQLSQAQRNLRQAQRAYAQAVASSNRQANRRRRTRHKTGSSKADRRKQSAIQYGNRLINQLIP